ISGSDKYGLPTYRHHDLLVGLIQLTWEKTGASSPRVEFTRYELLKLLGWPKTGRYYALIEQAIDVWMGTTLYYKDSWWVDGAWKSKTFNLLEDAEIHGSRGGGPRKRTKEQLLNEPSYVVWGSVPFTDFQAKRTKGLDYGFYRSLKYAVSRQLYRYLDKWFHYGPNYRYPDLRMFACEKIGLSRRHDNSNLIRELERGVGELVERGYLCDTSKQKRYRKSGRLYEVCFERKKSRKEFTRQPSLSKMQSELVGELKRRGLRNEVPLELVQECTPADIRRTIDNFDDRVAHGESVSPGFLVAALRSEEGYAYRKGFEPQTVKDARKKAKEELEALREKHEIILRQIEQSLETLPIESLTSLNARQRAMLEQEALTKSSSYIADGLERAEREGNFGKSKELRTFAIQKLYKSVERAVIDEVDTRGAATAWVKYTTQLRQELELSPLWSERKFISDSIRKAEVRVSSLPKISGR
ncbi:MAG: replication initiator protein A, partial [Lacipirellulaceae bacterium]